MSRNLSLLVAGSLLTAALLPAQALIHRHTHSRHHSAGSRRTPSSATPATKSVQVWVNTNTGVYHYPGERWYGNTKEGKYMSEAAAKAEGDRPTQNGQ